MSSLMLLLIVLSLYNALSLSLSYLLVFFVFD